MAEGVSGISSGTSSSTSAAQKSSVVGKDEFLKLLTYQLKAQNPMKPYDNQEFAAQLAQFSQLEQLTDIKSLLEEQVNTYSMLSQTMTNSALPGMLGKNAKAYTSSISFNGDDAIDVGYKASTASASGTLNILNEAGNVIRTYKLEGTNLTSGEHNISWDGKDDAGNDMPKGSYKVEVDLNSSTGSSVSADTFLTGKVEAVRFKSEGTMLVINGQEVALGNVVDIRS